VAFLGRKIAAAQWAKKPDFGDDEVPADTVTKDLRTFGNILSFWASEEGAPEPWRNAALAMGAASERLDSVDITWIGREELVEDGIALFATDGDTPVADLRTTHFDAARLDGHRLARVARRVALAVRGGEPRLRRITKSELATMLAEAVNSSRLRLEDLKDSVRAEVAARLPERGA
jgi:hypothetical protein